MLEEKVQDLVDEIHRQTIVVEYFRLRNLIEQSPEIKALRKQLSDAQVALSLSFVDPKQHEAKKTFYETLLNEFNNHPLIANYESLKSELRDLLKNIAELL